VSHVVREVDTVQHLLVVDRGVRDDNTALIEHRLDVCQHFRVCLGAVLGQNIFILHAQAQALWGGTVLDVRRVKHETVVDGIAVDVDHADAADAAFPPADVVVEYHPFAV
jgi:hypothetical protein